MKGSIMTYVAILGFGVVGSGAAEVLAENHEIIRKNLGEQVQVKRILDLRDFPDSPYGELITHDYADILNDEEISVVAEMMGGSHPAFEFTKAALEAGKHVVTSNKEVVANFGAELLRIANERGVRYLFEASVGGGIPIIRPLTHDLSSNVICSISGILNGTTNYILTAMIKRGISFADALGEAQKKGYAEANPAADVEGKDAARKITILAALSFGKLLSPDLIHCEGITTITAEQVKMAEELGFAVKLIGQTRKDGDKILAMVSPRLVPFSSPLAGVGDVFNGITVNANMVGEVMFYGKGAGKLPTASAVVADMIDIVAHRDKAMKNPDWVPAVADDYADFSRCVFSSCYFLQGNETDKKRLCARFPGAPICCRNGQIALITPPMPEKDSETVLAKAELPLISRIRLL